MVPLCSAQPAQLDLAAVEHRGQRHRGGESLWWVQVTLIKVGGVAWWLSGRRSGVRKECRVWQRGSRKEKWGLMTPHSVVLLSFKAEDLPSGTCIFLLPPTLVLPPSNLTRLLRFKSGCLILDQEVEALGKNQEIRVSVLLYC